MNSAALSRRPQSPPTSPASRTSAADSTTRTPQFSAKIDGKPLAAEIELLECVVESSLHLPDVCTMRIYDYDFKWLDSSDFKEGKKLEVEAGWDQKSLQPIFEGEIVGVELDLAAHHTATMVVRAYDKSHRLHRGRKCKTFVDVKDSDVASQVAGAAGLAVEAQATTVVRKWILQNNQTDWEFLVDLAARNGHDLFMKAGKLYFLKAGDRREFKRVRIVWGEDLRSFRPRTSASTQVKDVEVRGWDPITKQAIVGQSKAPEGAPEIGGENNGATVARDFGQQKTVVVDQPVHSQAEAELLAQSIRNQMGQGFLTADGLCDGAPEVLAGTAIEIANIGTRFSGTYYVTSATHVFSPAEGFTTQFAVSGGQPDNLLSLLENAKDPTVSQMGGNIVIAVVTDNVDPEGLGRVKVMYPWMADNLGSFWARMVSQMAGKERGFFNLPEVGDEVLVAFEHGETSRPYVLGMLWNGKDKPPKPSGNSEVAGGAVNRRGYYTRVGHKLDFDDTPGKESVTITTQGGHIVTLHDGDKNIKLQTTGGHTVTMDDSGSKIQLQDSGGDKIVMEASGKISLQANVEINISAPKITIKADAQLNAQGAQVSVKGTGTLGLEAGGQATLKGGAQVGIQSAIVDVTGGLVKINS